MHFIVVCCFTWEVKCYHYALLHTVCHEYKHYTVYVFYSTQLSYQNWLTWTYSSSMSTHWQQEGVCVTGPQCDEVMICSLICLYSFKERGVVNALLNLTEVNKIITRISLNLIYNFKCWVSAWNTFTYQDNCRNTFDWLNWYLSPGADLDF